MNNSAEISKPQITYSSIPQKKDSLPKEDNKIIKLETNLFEITNLKTDYKLCIYDVSLEYVNYSVDIIYLDLVIIHSLI